MHSNQSWYNLLYCTKPARIESMIRHHSYVPTPRTIKELIRAYVCDHLADLAKSELLSSMAVKKKVPCDDCQVNPVNPVNPSDLFWGRLCNRRSFCLCWRHDPSTSFNNHPTYRPQRQEMIIRYCSIVILTE